MLNITDLKVNKQLDRNELTKVVGGWGHPKKCCDYSTTLNNKVADVDQVFAFALDQKNLGQVTNNQAIQGGNGIVFAPVRQNLNQSNRLNIFGLGNTQVS